MTICLTIGQVANLMRIFTEFQNHINFMILGKFSTHSPEPLSHYVSSIALVSSCLILILLNIPDIFVHVSMMAIFFWLSSLGYFIWKTFRSRNVFLRITDGKKYCWYSCYVWGSTLCMASLGVFAHYYLEISTPKKSFSDKPEDIESIGGC